MTVAMRAVRAVPQGDKCLRIGVIRDGRIVEERLLRDHETVTAGASEKCHVVVAGAGLGARHDLFVRARDHYLLRFTGAMRGRVALPGGPRTLEELRVSGGARDAGAFHEVRLDDASRGRIDLGGGVTILFQHVVPPPAQPRPQLPAAARGGVASNLDWTFTGFVVFSYMLFFGAIAYLEAADWPLAGTIGEVPMELASLVLEQPEPPSEPLDTETPVDDATDDATDDASTQTPTARNRRRTNDATPPPDANAVARIAEDARADANLLMIGALGESGALRDLMAQGADITDAAGALADASRIGIADRSDTMLRDRDGGGSGQTRPFGRLATHGPTGPVDEGAPVDERVVYVGMEPPDEPIGGRGVFDSAEVARLLRGRQSAFRRCYETALREDPTLDGRVVVEFTIEERGNVSGSRAVENNTGNAGLGTCVAGVIYRLRWPEGPSGGTVEFSNTFVFAQQN